MNRFLILYGTTDGHTAQVARFLADELRALGASVDVFEAGPADPEPVGYDGVIVAASVHIGGYQREVVRWVRAHAPGLRGSNSAFVSVCLGVLQKDPEVTRELTAIRDRFIARTGWAPAHFKPVAGAVLYTHYGWLKRLVMKRIVRKAGGGTDTRRDYDYTDWDDLRTFAADLFARGTPGATLPRAGTELPPLTRRTGGPPLATK